MTIQSSASALDADHLSLFCHQLGLFLKAGMGVAEGVSLLRQDADPALKAVLEPLQQSLEGNRSLSAAMEEKGGFPRYLVRMVEIGQAAGRLDQVMEALSVYYRRQSQTHTAIRRAVLYPAMMTLLAAAVFLVLIARVLPVFQQVFLQLGMTLSPLAQFFLRAGALGKYLGGALLLLMVGWAAYLLWLSHRHGQQAQPAELGLLGSGPLRLTVGRSQFASAMSLMLSSGLPLDEAMERTLHLLEGTALAPRLTTCMAAMEGGLPLPTALADCGLLEAVQAGLLGAGLRTGNVEQSMEELASRCQSEAEERLTQLLTRLEFSLILLLCLAVGLVLLSVMLPLLGVLSTIG